MKRFLLFVAAMIVSVFVSAQVQRNIVILEIGTGVGCGFCPGAAMGAADLLAAGCQVGVIEYHNYNPSSDPFSNAYAAVRTNYYGITGYPTAFFDGVLNHEGGSHTESLYPVYLPLYQQRYAVPSPLTINISGSNTGNVYNITLTITKVGTIPGTNLKAHLALTESNIPYSWQGQTVINDAERLMAPDANGTSISFASGNTVSVNLTFTKDPAWVTSNCELVAFVQDDDSKEIHNGSKVALNNLSLPLPVAFTGTPTNGCIPMTVNFTDQSVGATVWNWSFPGGTPATSTLQNPVIVYNTPGTYDVTLSASNPVTNQYGSLSQAGYITVNTTPIAPGTPQGNSSLCVNPNNETYTTNPVANTTGYVWELLPVTAGVLTNNGTSCIIDWDNAFTGIAQLHVRCINGCGNSSWSSYLNISINPVPGQAGDPTGPTSLCMNSGSSNYVTTGSVGASTYTWELTPATAGTLFPNGTSASIFWSSAYSGTATLRVEGVNGNCEGLWSNPLTITVTPGPVAFAVSGGGVYCAVGGTGLPVDLNGSETNSNYTLYLDGTATTTVIPGTGSPISFGNQMNAGTYTVIASSGVCSNTMTGSAAITVDPQAPLAPDAPDGPEHIYSGATATADYITTGGSYATTYSWELTPSDAGTITGASTTGTATWNPVYSGPAIIKVQGVNSCGAGSYSVEFNVTVDVGVGIQEHNNMKLVTIYPNPAKSFITITPNHTIDANISIYNTLGVMVRTHENVTLSGNFKLDISTLKAGIYFIHLKSGEGQQIIKLVVS
ncbi:MAG: T9SS type A sorting domain-containing protein [Bacteroidales bacterium]|nr:T9SS type A sorting domain-containing protein [Bacteroidales bacterium]